MHKSLDEFEFRSTDLAALERLKIQCLHLVPSPSGWTTKPQDYE